MVEVDGAYVGGHMKMENNKADRPDRRLHVPAKRQSVVVSRERGGRALVTVAATEAAAVPFIRSVVPVGAVVHADEQAAGVACKPTTMCAASITRSRSAGTAPAQTKRQLLSLASAAPRWGSTTTLAQVSAGLCRRDGVA